MSQRAFVTVSGALALLGCTAQAPRPDRSQEDAWLSKAYEKYSNYDTEADVLPFTRGRVERNGDILTLILADGGNVKLGSNRNGCEGDDEHPSEECELFQLVADLPSRHFYLVVTAYYEGADYFLIDDRTGRKTRIGAVPIFSPDGKHFLVQDDNVAWDHENNLEIWRRENDGATLEWANSIQQAQVETSDSMLYHTSVTKWDGNQISLSFSNNVGDRSETTWTGNITKAPTGWRLCADWPVQNDALCYEPDRAR